MTKCRYVAVFVALVFLTVDGAIGVDIYAASGAEAQTPCPLVGESCGQGNTKDCYYKFTVKKDKKGSLDVQYPVSVFSETRPEEKDKAEEKEHVKKVKDKIFTISVKPGTTAKEGDTYAFKRCPDPLYEKGEKLDPTDPTPDK